MRRFSKRQYLMAAALGLIGTPIASGATRYWDPLHTPATPSGGNGTWGTALDWSSLSTDAAWSNSGEFNVASFGGTAGTVTVNRSGANTLADGLEFTVGGYTINSNTPADAIQFSGTNALTLTDTIASGDTTINAALVQSNASTFTNNGVGGLIINGGISGNFALTVSGTGNVTLGGNVTTGNTALTINNTGTTTLGGTNTYSGITAITAGASGIVRINGSNNSAGGTTVNSGTLQLGNASNGGLASGTLILGHTTNLTGATLQAVGGSRTLSNAVQLKYNSTISGANDLQVNGTVANQTTGNITLTNSLDSSKKLTLTNTFTMVTGTTNGITVTLDGTGDTEISGVLKGSGTNGDGAQRLTVSSLGTTTMSGSSSNTYLGTTTVNAGATLVLNKSGAANAIRGTTIIDGGTIRYASTAGDDQIAAGKNVTIKNGGLLDLNGISDSIYNVTFDGTGQNRLTTGTGILTTVTQNSYNASGTNPGRATISGRMTAGSFNILRSTNAGGVELDVQAELLGSGALQTTATSTGVLRISGNNSYTGETKVAGGTVQLNHAGALGSTSGVTILTGGALDLNGLNGFTAPLVSIKGSGGIGGGGALINSSAAAASYNGAITLAGDATIGAIGGNISIGSTISGPATDAAAEPGVVTLNFAGDHQSTLNGAMANGVGTTALAVAKVGLGTLELTVGSTYTGGTVVSEGALAVNNTSGSATGTGSVSVRTGATLRGSGSISGSVASIGGIFTPGNSVGILSVGGLALDSASVLRFEFNATDHMVGGNVNDLLVVNGDLTLDGMLDLGGVIGGTDLTAGHYRVLNYSGSLIDNGLVVGTGFSSAYTYSIAAGGGTVDLVVSIVPEPTAFGLLACGSLFMLRRRR